MSGGTFDYNQYRIHVIVDLLEEELKTPSFEHSQNTIDTIQTAIIKLNEAFTYAHRLDWYLAGDDSETNLHKRLAEDLAKSVK